MDDREIKTYYTDDFYYYLPHEFDGQSTCSNCGKEIDIEWDKRAEVSVATKNDQSYVVASVKGRIKDDVSSENVDAIIRSGTCNKIYVTLQYASTTNEYYLSEGERFVETNRIWNDDTKDFEFKLYLSEDMFGTDSAQIEFEPIFLFENNSYVSGSWKTCSYTKLTSASAIATLGSNADEEESELASESDSKSGVDEATESDAEEKPVEIPVDESKGVPPETPIEAIPNEITKDVTTRIEELINEEEGE